MATSNYTKKDLEELIKELTGLEKLTPLINKHINQLIIEYDMTIKEIARCLVYAVDIKRMKLDVTQYGIKFVVNIKEETARYFAGLEAERARQQKEATKPIEIQENNIIISLTTIGNRKRKKTKNEQLDFDDIKIEEDSDE